ncbi:hypothetical protein AALK14_00850 [Butyricimonas hominis]|uniref:hypothetical protein n=1 Tax=Butyricimonas TaxID=574697 RepID=UPI003516D5DA
MRNIFLVFRKKVELYGIKNAIGLGLKFVFRKLFCISWNTYYLMSIKSRNKVIVLPERVEVRLLKLSDFARDIDASFFTKEKKRIYEERFQDKTMKGFGVFEDGKLACFAWLSLKRMEITTTFNFDLPYSSALLFDDYTQFGFRGKGYHHLINDFRIKYCYQNNIKNIYVFVVRHNVPALKTQIKSGLEIKKKFTLWNIGGKEICSKKII